MEGLVPLTQRTFARQFIHQATRPKLIQPGAKQLQLRLKLHTLVQAVCHIKLHVPVSGWLCLGNFTS